MKKFLHVGCGQKDKRNTTKGFNSEEWHETRLDIDESVKPDIVGSITDLATIPSGTFDALFSSHNIEHLYPHLVPIALKEFRRVLKHDGFLVITCPDLLSTAESDKFSHRQPGGSARKNAPRSKTVSVPDHHLRG